MQKTIKAELYNLFGPNGSDQLVGTFQKARLKACRYLESIGIVRIEIIQHCNTECAKVIRVFRK